MSRSWHTRLESEDSMTGRNHNVRLFFGHGHKPQRIQHSRVKPSTNFQTGFTVSRKHRGNTRIPGRPPAFASLNLSPPAKNIPPSRYHILPFCGDHCGSFRCRSPAGHRLPAAGSHFISTTSSSGSKPKYNVCHDQRPCPFPTRLVPRHSPSPGRRRR